jgi:hypothetical protein
MEEESLDRVDSVQKLVNEINMELGKVHDLVNFFF